MLLMDELANETNGTVDPDDVGDDAAALMIKALAYRWILPSVCIFGLIGNIGNLMTLHSPVLQVETKASWVHAYLTGLRSVIGLHCGPHDRGPVPRWAPWAVGVRRVGARICECGAHGELLWTSANLNPVKHSWVAFWMLSCKFALYISAMMEVLTTNRMSSGMFS